MLSTKSYLRPYDGPAILHNVISSLNSGRSLSLSGRYPEKRRLPIFFSDVHTRKTAQQDRTTTLSPVWKVYNYSWHWNHCTDSHCDNTDMFEWHDIHCRMIWVISSFRQPHHIAFALHGIFNSKLALDCYKTFLLSKRFNTILQYKFRVLRGFPFELSWRDILVRW